MSKQILDKLDLIHLKKFEDDSVVTTSEPLRETHITTIDSPELKITISDRDEAAMLHDIKEEEEDQQRTSPPSEIGAILAEPLPIRPVSPREEEVFKIVADVAKVLKSEKDITEIIPDFDEKQLEEKLKSTDEVETEAPTVQRMLVTASSEDGGEEIEICPKGSIQFTPSTITETVGEKEKPVLDKDIC